jgi:hypothetical protein
VGVSRGLAPFAATAALLLAGCEVYAVPDPYPCPGVQKGVFDFSGTLITDVVPTCYFAQPGNGFPPPPPVNNPMEPFQGTISFDGDVAALCVGNAHAAINLGTHGGPPDAPTIDVFYPEVEPGTPVSVVGCTCPSTAAVTASGCSCPSSSPTSNCSCQALLRQNIVGTLIPATRGFSGFTGAMINTVKFRPGLSPDLACDCLRTTPVGMSPPVMECSYSYSLTATSVGTR